MNTLVVKGFSIYKIFIKNKVASSIMMLVSGIMMFIAALNGKGNDTKTMPIMITLVGVILAFWSFYRTGYIKSTYDKLEPGDAKDIERHVFFFQIFESAIYFAVAAVGFFLILNEGFMNIVLNLMSGGFTIMNAVFGMIYIFHNLDNKDWKWKFRIFLTIVEIVIGVYFIVVCSSINTTGFMIMGAVTTVAGIIEVISSVNAKSIKDTVQDGKEIVNTLKN